MHVIGCCLSASSDGSKYSSTLMFNNTQISFFNFFLFMCVCVCVRVLSTGVCVCWPLLLWCAGDEITVSCSALRPVIPMHSTLMHRCPVCVFCVHANLHIIVNLCPGGVFDFELTLQLSICASASHPSLLSLCLSLSSSLGALCLCRLDLSQLFAGFKDKEILIELLCNSTSQCINRQLDINQLQPLCVLVRVCVHAYERDSVSFVSVVKSLPIDPARGCCDLLP